MRCNNLSQPLMETLTTVTMHVKIQTVSHTRPFFVSCIIVCVGNDSFHCLKQMGPAGPSKGVVPRGTGRLGPERSDKMV